MCHQFIKLLWSHGEFLLFLWAQKHLKVRFEPTTFRLPVLNLPQVATAPVRQHSSLASYKLLKTYNQLILVGSCMIPVFSLHIPPPGSVWVGSFALLMIPTCRRRRPACRAARTTFPPLSAPPAESATETESPVPEASLGRRQVSEVPAGVGGRRSLQTETPGCC